MAGDDIEWAQHCRDPHGLRRKSEFGCHDDVSGARCKSSSWALVGMAAGLEGAVKLGDVVLADLVIRMSLAE